MMSEKSAEEVLQDVLKKLVNLGTIEFDGISDYGAEIETDEMMGIMRFIGLNEQSEVVIDEFLEESKKIYKSTLTLCLASYIKKKQEKMTEENEETMKMTPADTRRSRLALRLLVNLTGRSQKLRDSITHECIDLIESIAAIGQFDTELIHLLIVTAETSYLEFQKSPRYSDMLIRILDIFYRANEKMETEGKEKGGDASSVVAYLSVLLEKDYGFLANCYAEMSADKFVDLLAIVHLIVENTQSKIHVNNLVFVIDLLELMTQDYEAYLTAKTRIENSMEKRRKSTLSSLRLLVDIIGDATSKNEMRAHLLEKPRAMELVVDVLDAALDAEAQFGEARLEKGSDWPEIPDEVGYEEVRKHRKEERRIEEARKKHADRPTPPMLSRILRVENSSSLSALSNTLLKEGYEKMRRDYDENGNLKLACLMAIAHLCDENDTNQSAAVSSGRCALLSVLQCSTRRPLWFMESFTIQKWAIICVRQLTSGSRENKEVILNLQQPSQPIIDRDRLLNEFGFRAEADESNKMRLVRVDEESTMEMD